MIALTVQGVAISAEQRDAGLAAMVGVFEKYDIERALRRVGLSSGLADDAADRLLQSERRAGRIRHTGGGWWERMT